MLYNEFNPHAIAIQAWVEFTYLSNSLIASVPNIDKRFKRHMQVVKEDYCIDDRTWEKSCESVNKYTLESIRFWYASYTVYLLRRWTP